MPHGHLAVELHFVYAGKTRWACVLWCSGAAGAVPLDPLRIASEPSHAELVQTLLDADAEIAGPRERITPQEWNSEPEHLNGALQLVPLTKDDVQDMELRPHHVIAMRKDISIIKEALAYISRRHGGRAAKE